eukprot:4431806-Alexandrium_andersonii.AAC.1
MQQMQHPGMPQAQLPLAQPVVAPPSAQPAPCLLARPMPPAPQGQAMQGTPAGPQTQEHEARNGDMKALLDT